MKKYTMNNGNDIGQNTAQTPATTQSSSWALPMRLSVNPKINTVRIKPKI